MKRGKRGKKRQSITLQRPLQNWPTCTHTSYKPESIKGSSFWRSLFCPLPWYYPWQRLLNEFQHTLMLCWILEEQAKRFDIMAVVRQQASHGRSHGCFPDDSKKKIESNSSKNKCQDTEQSLQLSYIIKGCLVTSGIQAVEALSTQA